MGNKLYKINFEDMQIAIQNPNQYIIINTLNNTEQYCLIKNTISIDMEENIINRYLGENRYIHIIIYGKNGNDENINKKYNQLSSLGFSNIYIYIGGLFEWLLLQDIYSNEFFPTTTLCQDILKYKPISILKNIK